MGTWNTKPFGNDAASDWLWELEKASDESVLRTALGKDAKEDVAIAAAALIEAARRQPLGKLPPRAKAWVSERGFVPSNALVKQAIRAAERIKTKSDLRELWEESSSFNSWLKQMDSLLAGLRQVNSQPPPVRSPKAPPTPRRLDKIIENVKPDEVSSLRETLRKKLEAIADLEAPVTGPLFPKPPLTLLAQQGLLPEAKRLVERGAKVNPVVDQNSSTPLEAACWSGHAELAKWLLEQGAIIYVERTQLVRVSDTESESKKFASPFALYYAVKSGSIATIQALVRHGARLDTGDIEAKLRKYGFGHDTLLHKAVDANHPHVVEFLVKSGLSLEARDDFDSTPLMRAANQTNNSINNDTSKVVEMLLSLGANPNAKDKHGFTALDCVSESKSEVAKLIKNYGGRFGKDVPNDGA